MKSEEADGGAGHGRKKWTLSEHVILGVDETRCARARKELEKSSTSSAIPSLDKTRRPSVKSSSEPTKEMRKHTVYLRQLMSPCVRGAVSLVDVHAHVAPRSPWSGAVGSAKQAHVMDDRGESESSRAFLSSMNFLELQSLPLQTHLPNRSIRFARTLPLISDASRAEPAGLYDAPLARRVTAHSRKGGQLDITQRSLANWVASVGADPMRT